MDFLSQWIGRNGDLPEKNLHQFKKRIRMHFKVEYRLPPHVPGWFTDFFDSISNHVDWDWANSLWRWFDGFFYFKAWIFTISSSMKSDW